MNQLQPIQHLSQDPYNSSDDEENILLSQISDAYSVTSQSLQSLHSLQSLQSTPSYVSQQRQTFCCPKPTYTKSRKALDRLLKSRNDLGEMEVELERERQRGRHLLTACVLMCILCAVLFVDKWPEDWRGSLIDVLERGRPESDGNNISSVNGEKNEGKHKDPLEAFRSEEKTGNDDDDHYSKYGNSYSAYKKSHGKSSHGHAGTSSSSSSSSARNDDDDNQENEGEEDPFLPENGDDDDDDGDDNTSSSTSKTKQSLVEENESLHIDHLSKFLKWNLPFKRDRDVPVFWHVPLTGTTLVDEIFGRCYKLTQAADVLDMISGHENDKVLNVVTVDSKRYVNVDMSSVSGIKRAKELHLARSGVSELIRTPHVYETALLFESTANYGKCFTLLRDPIQRSIDVFYKLKTSGKNKVFSSMTIEEYVNSPFCEDNWMVRVLSNEMEAELKQEHLELSKHILGRKCIVGLTEDFFESVRRFSKYFFWDETLSKDKLEKCQDDLEISEHVQSGNFTLLPPRAEVKSGDKVYTILQEKNHYDIQLYEYAKGLFHTQSLYGRFR
mmetsp:Transcript_27304/g.41093  ORF Transcript_27304/g.41093 Transcript_27304/m.41093 type:complete len:557 (-) Transcript_27304:206-1876(-)|eukprot:CAMPEP_0203675062 /NCGR_PEP_ID=MMETSP0090-20130426/18596_1 /ASSEMBLY_ACC=CAM_ASM_001088 /TAXON_ID=426623 /ORGANISM="Chaetoceros affinis, Strain CCMP159" /LENGTH=556 /DNA_ID=CAMNT_0050541117 /DNA_START=30 /DNA_END=1700 /DNA_ORIENTATION=+